jgi:hypothetical protein
MKKLVLFFAVAAALSFAACSNAPKQEQAPEEVPVVAEPAPEAIVADTTTAEVPAAEVVPAEAPAQ